MAVTAFRAFASRAMALGTHKRPATASILLSLAAAPNPSPLHMWGARHGNGRLGTHTSPAQKFLRPSFGLRYNSEAVKSAEFASPPQDLSPERLPISENTPEQNSEGSTDVKNRDDKSEPWDEEGEEYQSQLQILSNKLARGKSYFSNRQQPEAGEQLWKRTLRRLRYSWREKYLGFDTFASAQWRIIGQRFQRAFVVGARLNDQLESESKADELEVLDHILEGLAIRLIAHKKGAPTPVLTGRNVFVVEHVARVEAEIKSNDTNTHSYMEEYWTELPDEIKAKYEAMARVFLEKRLRKRMQVAGTAFSLIASEEENVKKGKAAPKKKAAAKSEGKAKANEANTEKQTESEMEKKAFREARLEDQRWLAEEAKAKEAEAKAKAKAEPKEGAKTAEPKAEAKAPKMKAAKRAEAKAPKTAEARANAKEAEAKQANIKAAKATKRAEAKAATKAKAKAEGAKQAKEAEAKAAKIQAAKAAKLQAAKTAKQAEAKAKQAEAKAKQTRQAKQAEAKAKQAKEAETKARQAKEAETKARQAKEAETKARQAKEAETKAKQAETKAKSKAAKEAKAKQAEAKARQTREAKAKARAKGKVKESKQRPKKN